MPVDPRLNEIDDCLYRVSVRVIINQKGKVLLVQENELCWALPGGGVDHGESIKSAIPREVEEELGVPADNVSSDFQIVYYSIGYVVDGVPRMNLYFRASVPSDKLTDTDEVARWDWFTKDEFLELNLHPSYSKNELADVIFGNEHD